MRQLWFKWNNERIHASSGLLMLKIALKVISIVILSTIAYAQSWKQPLDTVQPQTKRIEYNLNRGLRWLNLMNLGIENRNDFGIHVRGFEYMQSLVPGCGRLMIGSYIIDIGGNSHNREGITLSVLPISTSLVLWGVPKEADVIRYEKLNCPPYMRGDVATIRYKWIPGNYSKIQFVSPLFAIRTTIAFWASKHFSEEYAGYVGAGIKGRYIEFLLHFSVGQLATQKPPVIPWSIGIDAGVQYWEAKYDNFEFQWMKEVIESPDYFVRIYLMTGLITPLNKFLIPFTSPK